MAAPAYYNKPLGTCYALRYPDLLAGFCGGVPSRCDFAGLLDHWNTHGRAGPQPHSITRHPLPLPLTWDEMRTSPVAEGRFRACAGPDVQCYAMSHPKLLQAYCGGVLANCDWEKGEFLKHYASTGSKSWMPDCHTAAAQCYIEDNPDLLQYVCGGSVSSCNWYEVQKHWHDAGKDEGRAFACSPPSPPAPKRSPPPPRPPPFASARASRTARASAAST